jgi:hypothetical protein
MGRHMKVRNGGGGIRPVTVVDPVFGPVGASVSHDGLSPPLRSACDSMEVPNRKSSISLVW